MKDRNPHPSVQPWSRGPIFPAVIAQVETYADWGAAMNQRTALENRRLATMHELRYPGREPVQYYSYADAEMAARWLNVGVTDPAGVPVVDEHAQYDSMGVL